MALEEQWWLLRISGSSGGAVVALEEQWWLKGAVVAQRSSGGSEEQWWLRGAVVAQRSSGGSLVAKPACKPAFLISHPGISSACSGLAILRWAAIWDGTPL